MSRQRNIYTLKKSVNLTHIFAQIFTLLKLGFKTRLKLCLTHFKLGFTTNLKHMLRCLNTPLGVLQNAPQDVFSACPNFDTP